MFGVPQQGDYLYYDDDDLEQQRTEEVKSALRRLSEGNRQAKKSVVTPTKLPFSGNGIRGRGLIQRHQVRYSSNEVSNESKQPIYGRGLSEAKSEDKKYKPYRKYYNKIYIDLNKLKKNVLFCKYIQKHTNVVGLRTQSISDDLRDLIFDTINEKYNKKVFTTLNTTDKAIFKRFAKAFKFNLDIPDDAELSEFREKFKVLVGSWYAGNDSDELKKELIKYVRQAIALGMITQQESHSLLFELTSS